MPLPAVRSDSRESRIKPARLVATGMVARADTLAAATLARFEDGPAKGFRFIDVSMSDGLTFRVLPDRGFDIGAASVAGLPIAWLSAVGYCAPVSEGDQQADPDGLGWLARFTGGLLTTCGPDNIGLPSVDLGIGHGLHGGWTDMRADDVTIDRSFVDDEIELTVGATMQFRGVDNADLHIKRSIVTRTGTPSVDVIDSITNNGPGHEPILMLYHVNFGAPLWVPGATVSYPPSTTTTPRTPHAATMLSVADQAPVASSDAEEYVFERVVAECESTGVTVTNEQVGLRVRVQWMSETLPISHQWVQPAEGTYALGIEPANAGLAGRGVLRREGTLPMIDSGQTLQFAVRVSAEFV